MVAESLSKDNFKVLWKYEKFRLGYCQCGCGTEIPLRVSKGSRRGRLRRFVHNHHTRLRLRELHPNYKGGRPKVNGYIKILKPEHPFADHLGYVKEHRLVWEEYHKACLLPWADVHHKNIHNLSKEENKMDNTPENLQAMMHKDHTSLSNEELKKETTITQCVICGTLYMIYVAIKYENKKCGRCYMREYQRNYMRKRREKLRIETRTAETLRSKG